MFYRFKEEFISKILVLGTILLFLLSVIIFFSLTQYKLLIWIILVSAFPIYLFICFHYLKDYLLLTKTNMYQKFDELNYRIEKNIPITILEILFWVSCLIISISFLYIHGFYLVDYEIYYEKAELYYYFLFGGSEPVSQSLSQNMIMNLFYRPLYPLLIVIFSLPLNLFLSVRMSFDFSGILISIISGFLILYFSGKIIKMLSTNKISTRIGRLLIGTTPTFIIFWTKFSTELLFILFFTISFYILLKYSKYRRRKDLILFLITAFLTCLTREVGVFLFFSALVIFLNSKKKLLKILKITGFICIVVISFIIFFDTLINTRYRFWYFYNNVYPVENFYPSFHFFNFLNWIIILFNGFFNFEVMRNLFFSSLWSFGVFFILLLIYIISAFIKRIKKKWSNMNNKYLNYIKRIEKNRSKMNNRYFNYIKKSLLKSKIFQIKFDLKIFSSFFTPYFLFLLIFISPYFSERYFLPIAILLIISFLMGNKKELNYKVQTLLIYGVIYNLVLLASRIIFISIL